VEGGDRVVVLVLRGQRVRPAEGDAVRLGAAGGRDQVVERSSRDGDGWRARGQRGERPARGGLLLHRPGRGSGGRGRAGAGAAAGGAGLSDSVPEPALDAFTVTLGEPEPSEVSEPPLVEDSCTVQVAGPEFAACVAAAAPLELPEVSP